MSKWVDLDNVPYVCQDMTVKQLIEKTEIHENVIERSKIDKAIEEIDDLSCTIGDYSYSGGLGMALEILKRNIGE